MKASIELVADVARTPRVLQVEGLFDVPPAERSTSTWEVDLPIEELGWHVGLIVGPSGAGKSTVARALFGEKSLTRWRWPKGRSVLDGFPAGLGIQEITELLVAVGFGTTPSWLRPYSALSTGEQFRVDLARSLAESPELAVVDEFTSVVDRQVAKVGSHAVAKAVRRRGQRLVAVACHYDIVDWLQPDWLYEPHLGAFTARSLQPRPAITLDVCQVERDAWEVFRKYHYLSARCPPGDYWGGFVDGQCVAFMVVAGFPHPKVRDIRRARRQVVLPDWQGIGIARHMEEWLAARYTAEGYRFRHVVAHPGMVRSHLRNPNWTLVHQASRANLKSGARARIAGHQASARMMLLKTFEWHPVGSGSASG